MSIAAQKPATADQEHGKLESPQESLQNADALFQSQRYSEAYSKYLDANVSGNSAQQSEAAFKIGMMYVNGNGFVSDVDQARIWLQKAAGQGSLDATNELAKLDAPPSGPDAKSAAQSQPQTAATAQAPTVVQSREQSATPYDQFNTLVSKAAQNDATAQYEVGLRYESGNGVEAELGHARYWLQKAAEQGNAAAKSELTKLDAPPSGPTPTQLAESQPVAAAQGPANAPQAAAQPMTKNDIDDSDTAAFQQKLRVAHDAKFPLKAHNSIEKSCFTGGKGASSEGPRGDCLTAADNYPQYREALLLKGCSFPDETHTSNSCLFLAYMYVGQGRYLEALAVYESPDIRNGLQRFDWDILGEELKIFAILGNKPKEMAILNKECYQDTDYLACESLNQLGQSVDLQAALDRGVTDTTSAHDDAIMAQTQADQQEAANEKRQNSRATINAIYSAVGVTGSSGSSGNAMNDALAQQQAQLAATAATIQQKAAQAAQAAQIAAQQKAAAEQAELSRQQATQAAAQAAALKQQEARQAAEAAAQVAAAPKVATPPVRVAYYYHGQTYQSYAALLAAAKASGNCDPNPEMGGQAPCDNASANAQAPLTSTAQIGSGQSPQPGTQSTAAKGQIWWVAFAFSPISSVAASLSGDGSYGVGTGTNEQAASDSALNHCDAVDTSDMRCNTGGTWAGTPDGSVRWYALAINRNARPVDDLHPWSYGTSVGYTSQSGAEQNALATCQIPNADGCAIVVSASVGGTN